MKEALSSNMMQCNRPNDGEARRARLFVPSRGRSELERTREIALDAAWVAGVSEKWGHWLFREIGVSEYTAWIF